MSLCHKECRKIKTVIQEFLVTEELEHKKIGVSVSGGVDSMVLLSVLLDIIPSNLIAVMHVNHKNRKESEEEYLFVQNFCTKNNLDFHGYEGVNTPENNKENYWRVFRNECREKMKKEAKCERVLTAHHATDLVETMIFRITKGCGVEGLSPFDVSTKPFWKISKSEIKDFAHIHAIEYRDDKSNTDTQYERNRIRHNVVPELRILTPNLEQVLVNESLLFGEISEYMKSEAQTQLRVWNDVISVKNFQELSRALQREILREIALENMSFSESEDALRWMNGSIRGGSQKNIGGRVWRVEKGQFLYE